MILNKGLILSFLFIASSLGFLRTHTRIQTTMLGYELGKLKSKESELMEKKSRLLMELARLTSKDRLTNLSDGIPAAYRNQTSLVLK